VEIFDLLECDNEEFHLFDEKIRMLCEPHVPQFPSVSAIMYDDYVTCDTNEVPQLAWFTPMYECVRNSKGVFANSTDQPYFNVTECSIDGTGDQIDTAHTTFYYDALCSNATGSQLNEDLSVECILDLADKWDSFFGYPISEYASARMGCYPQETLIQTRAPTSMPSREPSNGGDDDGDQAGVIVGATIGTLFAVALICGIVYYTMYYNQPGPTMSGANGGTLNSKQPMQDQEGASDWFSRVAGFTGDNPHSGSNSKSSSNPIHAQTDQEESKNYELFKDGL
jgi:hypothetical protein